jgi:hypothetical protein
LIRSQLQTSRLPRGLELVVASAELHFPTKRRRDEGNFRVVIEKALGDVLVRGGWLPDDTPDHYRFERVRFSEKPGPHWTTLRLDWRLS